MMPLIDYSQQLNHMLMMPEVPRNTFQHQVIPSSLSGSHGGGVTQLPLQPVSLLCNVNTPFGYAQTDFTQRNEVNPFIQFNTLLQNHLGSSEMVSPLLFDPILLSASSSASSKMVLFQQIQVLQNIQGQLDDNKSSSLNAYQYSQLLQNRNWEQQRLQNLVKLHLCRERKRYMQQQMLLQMLALQQKMGVSIASNTEPLDTSGRVTSFSHEQVCEAAPVNAEATPMPLNTDAHATLSVPQEHVNNSCRGGVTQKPRRESQSSASAMTPAPAVSSMESTSMHSPDATTSESSDSSSSSSSSNLLMDPVAPVETDPTSSKLATEPDVEQQLVSKVSYEDLEYFMAPYGETLRIDAICAI